MPKLVTIVELAAFTRHCADELDEPQRDDLKVYLAANPEAGVLIQGTGGIRKLRWAASGRGKRGGGRVIYYFHDLEMPLYLLNFFTKAVKADLTAKEKQTLAALVKAIVAEHKKRE